MPGRQSARRAWTSNARAVERLARTLPALVPALLLAGCGEHAQLSVAAGTGPAPELGPPRPTLVPTVKVAPARGWPEGGMPRAADGLAVNAFASALDHPRWLYVLPNGDVLVAETNAPPRPQDGKGFKGWMMKQLKKKAGAGTPSANRISLLRDADGDGVAETRAVFLEGLNSPFGMTLVGSTLYVANTDALVAFPYRPGEVRISAAPTHVADLPAGPINHHWTKNVIASRDGAHLYVTVGSNSNIAENGLDKELERAAILEIDRATGARRVFASGLRNPNGLAFEPRGGALWTVVNERDEIGSDLVPDFLAEVHDGGFYGWPWSYYGNHVDERIDPARPEMVARALVPDYALGPHTASLGLAFNTGKLMRGPFGEGVFIGQHGSWNRRPPSGYCVIFVPFADTRPSGPPREVLTGFLDGQGNALGRPVGVALDNAGALLVADDVGNTVWRVRPAAAGTRAAH